MSGDQGNVARLRELTLGSFISQALSVVAALGVADELANGPLSSDELARQVRAHPEALYRVMRALASVGVFDESEPQIFSLNGVGYYLRTGVPGSMHGWAAMIGLPFHREAWTGLITTVRTGQPAFEHVHGNTLFEYLRGDPEASRVFDEAMAATVARRIPPFLAAYDFTDVALLVDVGGGAGVVLAAILDANPHLKAVLYDFPDVTERATHRLAEAGLADRCMCVGGDFIREIPSGGDLIMLSRIIPDWDDDRAIRILANCRAALTSGGKVILTDTMFPEDTASIRAKLGDLEMLVMTAGGRERSRDEYDCILRSAGLTVSRVIPSGDSNILEAVPL